PGIRGTSLQLVRATNRAVQKIFAAADRPPQARNSKAWEGPAMALDPVFADLAERAFAGDPAAIEGLVRQYESTVRRLVRHRLWKNWLRDYTDTLDLSQSVWRNLIQGSQRGHYQLEDPNDLLRLFRTIVERKIIDYQRHYRAEHERTSRATAEDLVDVVD